MSWPEPPVIPSITLPEPVEIGPPVLDIPRADLPSYRPLYVPPRSLRPPPGVTPIQEKKEQTTEKKSKPKKQTKPQTPELPPEAQLVQVPFTDVEIPMPTTTIMTTAATTAFISVGATLVGQSIFKYLVMIMKPIFKQAWNRIAKKGQASSSS